MRSTAWVRVFLGVGALLGCEAGDGGEVIVPDAGEALDVGSDLGGGEDAVDAQPATLDRPDSTSVDAPIPADVTAAMDALTSTDAPDVPGAPSDAPSDGPAPGCRSDDACRAAADGGATALRCDLARHECVQCLADADCPSGRVCTAGVCVAGCSAARACPGGETCCGGACVDLMVNPVSCGVCDNRCGLPNAVAFCRAGSCAVGTCAAGYADCDGAPANGCEVNAQTDVTHCGTCATVCPMGAHVAARTCVVGRCGVSCDVGFADCDGAAANGCEADLVASATQCGACGTVCPARPHAAPTCVSRSCSMRCDAGFADCNGSAADGCETALNTAGNCGACGRTVAEVCDGADNDCDGVADDGCPTGIGSLADGFASLQFGGTGGGSFADVCPGGVAIGFDGRAGSRIDQLGVRCMRLALTEDRSVTPFRYTVRAVGAATSPGARGGTGGTAFTASCDAGSFVSGVSGRSGSRVDQFAFGCGYWQVVGSPTAGWRLDLVATAGRGPWGGTGGTVFAYECPDGASGQHTAVTTLSGRSGSELDAIGVRCGLADIVVR